MRNNFLRRMAVAFALSAFVAGVSVPSYAGNPLLKAAPKTLAEGEGESGDDTTPPTVIRTIIDEDFSGLTAGTEDQPSEESLLNPSTGYVLDRSMFKPYTVGGENDHTWGGNNLFSAGGAIAVKSNKMINNHGDLVINTGFLNTPSGNMSGNLTISFRIKLSGEVITTNPDGEVPENPKLDVILLSRKQLVDYNRWTIELTNEWKEYTFTTSNGWFENTGIQFYPSYESIVGNLIINYLVDDIKVTQEITSIIPPEIEEPTDCTDTEFTALWYPTNDVEEYLLNVYTKTENPDIVKVTEGFNGITADASGALTGLPEGWSFNWAEEADRISADGGVGGSVAVRLKNYDDYVQTPAYKHDFSKFAIKFRVQSENAQKGLMLLSVQENGNWYPWQYASVEGIRQLNEWVTIDFSKELDMFDDVNAVRVAYQPAEGDDAIVLIDDVSYTVPSDPILTYFLQDKTLKPQRVTGEDEICRYKVTGLDPDEDYFYTVKARNVNFTSDESDEMEVFYVSTPVALEATDVNVANDSYTANWECGSKVDYYRVDQVREVVLEADDPDYVVLYEGFDKVKSHITEVGEGVEYGEPTSVYLPIDDLTELGGWKASSYQFINGWLGGNTKVGSEYIAGAIATPLMDLSHNDGICNVTVRAYGNENDWLIIQGVGAASMGAIEFPAGGGIVEATVTIPLCTEREYFTIYSNNYYPFLIDYILITQSMKAGETASITTKSITVNDAAQKSVAMENVGFDPEATFKYKVTAFRYFHGNEKDIWASYASNLMTVDQTTGIANTFATAESAVKAVEGGIVVTTDEAADIAVYRIDGSTVARRAADCGATRIDLDGGMYIVKVGNRSYKVIVR